MSGQYTPRLTDDTVVILTSDSGARRSSRPPCAAARDNSTRGDIRVPRVVSWPGLAKPGGTCDAPVSRINLYPTLLQLDLLSRICGSISAWGGCTPSGETVRFRRLAAFSIHKLFCRYLAVATRFLSCHRVGEVQVENSHPHGKTCTHNSNCPVRNQSRIRCRYLLWRQDFILSGKCKLKTRTHMGTLAPTIQKPWLGTS